MKKSLSRLFAPFWSGATLICGVAGLMRDVMGMPEKWRTALWLLFGVSLCISMWKGLDALQYRKIVRGIGTAMNRRTRAYGSGVLYRVRHPIDFSEARPFILEEQALYEAELTWSPERWNSFFQKNDRLVFSLDRNRGGSWGIVGGMSIMPLRREAAQKLRTGEIEESEIRADDILSPDELANCQHWHIGGIVVFQGAGSMSFACAHLIVGAIQLWLKEILVSLPIEVSAFAYSESGKNLLTNRFGFRPQERVANDRHQMSLFLSNVDNIEQLKERLAPLLVESGTN